MTVKENRGMSGELKKFDRDEHNIWDIRGKNAAIEFFGKSLKSKNLRVIENPNEHGIDILVVNDKDVVVSALEIEVRHGNWQGDIKFPFDEVNCIERKEYLWRKDQELFDKIPMKAHPNMKVYYVQMNDLCNRFVIIDGAKVLQYDKKRWDNRKAKGEYVRQVPIEECIQHRIPVNNNDNKEHMPEKGM